MIFQLRRDVLVSQHPWLPRDLKQGERVQRYDGHTYGAITPSGTAVTFDGQLPFYEVPTAALVKVG